MAGVVKDPSGAVLPGVTVEVTSPALIEKVRTVVTEREFNVYLTSGGKSELPSGVREAQTFGIPAHHRTVGGAQRNGVACKSDRDLLSL
jgi:hypothetical protein